MNREWITVEGNEAAANVAYQLSEVIAIYPVTPSSAMGESADAWAAAHRPNLWGVVPTVAEMQSEGGAAQRDVEFRWRLYAQLAALHREVPGRSSDAS